MRGDAAPFRWDGDNRGVLCVHGFTGTPFEMRYLGEHLHREGFTVVGPILAGHGGTPADLNATRWTDWYAGVCEELDALRARCDRVAVVGMSLGGALALHLARHRPDDIDAIATLGAPLWLPGSSRAVIRALRATPLGGWIAQIPKLGGGSDIRDPVMKAANPGLRAIPTRAVMELERFVAAVRTEVHLVRAPALIMHARRDHTVPHACSIELAERIGSEVVRRVSLYGSFHVITIDIERDVVAREVAAFLEHQLGAASQGATT
jgi:carboxylesterase